jgi:hypothetical protein
MRPNPPATTNFQQTLRTLPILDVGSCEPLKASIHGVALGLTVLMGAYNTAAWLRRRQRHLAINAVIYLAAAFWEQRHVAHHLIRCFPDRQVPESVQEVPIADERHAA